MKRIFKSVGMVWCLGWLAGPAWAQTPGSVTFRATVSDYTGKAGDAKHYTVVWVTKTNGGSNQFIKTLWIQGKWSSSSGAPNWGSSEWGSHCGTWNTARAGSTALDGYSSATATSYSVTNPSPPTSGIASNPINLTWNCRDASNNLVADGDYKFWIQYAEDSGQGPVTSGLAWTKRTTSFTTTYANQGTSGSPANGNNFTAMSTTWTPATVPPTFTSAAPPGTGTAGVAYSHTCTASGSTPISFAVTSGALPDGLTLSSAGAIAGTPTAAGTFTGTITASNGTAPNATQNFSIVISPGIVITSSPPPGTGMVGTAYQHTCTATGPGTISFAVSAGALPDGLTLSSAGLISGTPDAAGTFTGTIRASNGSTPNATQDFSITISPPVVLTSGSARLAVTLGSKGQPEHWQVVWVTTESGAFIKTLHIRGNEYAGDNAAFWDPHWSEHCPEWSAARGTSTALDGFTSATAPNYSAPNNPVTVTWNCRDASNNVVPDGNYKFWVQSAEDNTVAPVTTNGLLWTKTTTATSANPANQGTDFTAMSIQWTPDVLLSPYESWVASSGLPPEQSGPQQSPFHDGVTNLQKFAFNLDPSKHDMRHLAVGGPPVGLPNTTRVGGVLRLEFIRRKAGTNPGVNYFAEFSSELTGWTDFTAAGVPTSIDATWERVVVDDVPPPGNPAARYGRVRVVQTP